MKQGVLKESDRKLYPGYVFIELELDPNGMIPEKVWFMIKETEGVGDFIGSNGKPTPMSPVTRPRCWKRRRRPRTTPSSTSSLRRATRSRSPTGPSRTSRARSRRSSPTREWSGSSPPFSAGPPRWNWSIGRSRRCNRQPPQRTRMGGMFRVVEYTNRFQGVRSSFGGLPSWALGLVFLAALPGLILIALSILAFLVSLLSLLLLAVPVFRFMRPITAGGQNEVARSGVIIEQGRSYDSPGSKRVEATVIDPAVADQAAD